MPTIPYEEVFGKVVAAGPPTATATFPNWRAGDPFPRQGPEVGFGDVVRAEGDSYLVRVPRPDKLVLDSLSGV